MNIFEIIDIINKCLTSESRDKTKPLYGVCIETDPYKQLESCVPLVLLEENISKLITNPPGYVCEYLHLIDLTCVVSANKEDRNKYFMKVSELAANVIKSIGNLSDSRYRIMPRETAYGNVIMGSMKCSAVKISIEVKTLFMEN